MRILLTSDWHIGATLYGHDRGDDFRHYVDALCGLVERERPEWLIAAGDLFDGRNPSAAAELLYFDTLRRLIEAGDTPPRLLLIAGNHDNPSRLSAAAAFLRRAGVSIVTELRDNLVPLSDKVVAVAVPYVRAAMLRELPGYPDYDECLRQVIEGLLDEAEKRWPGCHKVLVAHTFANGARWGDDQAPYEIGHVESLDLTPFEGRVAHAALGHIHRRQTVAKCHWASYIGSALPLDFGEHGTPHGAELLDIDDAGATTLTFHALAPLRPLMSVPRQPRPLPEALEQLRLLPDEGEESQPRPFVQVNLLDDGADAERETLVRQALQGKRATLCQIRLHRPASEATRQAAPDPTTTDAAQVPPGEFLRQLWRARRGDDMPERVARLADHIVSQAREEQTPTTD